MSLDVSVITPTFRRPEKLVESVTSALSQSTVNLEVFVLDDSPEGSAKAAIDQINDPRVTYIKNEPPSGGKPAQVRNAGSKLAQGEFIHFLDDDDLVPEGTYAALVAALRDNPKIGMAFGRIEPFGNNPSVLQSQQEFFYDARRRSLLCQKLRSRRLMVMNMLFKNSVITTSAGMVRRECIDQLGGFNSECTPVEDVDFFARMVRRFGYIFLDRPALFYRTGEPSVMHNLNGNEALRVAYKNMYRDYERQYGALELMIMKILARTLFKSF